MVDVPSYSNPRVIAYRATRWQRLVKQDFIPPHNFYYTRRTLIGLVEKSGFQVVKAITGRYAIKSGISNATMNLIDQTANTFGIGGITLRLVKLR